MVFTNNPQERIHPCERKWNIPLFYSIISLISKEKTLGGLAGCSKGLSDAYGDNVAFVLTAIKQFVEPALVWPFDKTVYSRRELGLKRTSERPTVRQWAEGKCKQSTP